MSANFVPSTSSVRRVLVVASKLRPPTTTRLSPDDARTQASIGPYARPRRSSSLTPATSGVSDQPSPAYHSGRSNRYQSISFGRTPPSSSGYDIPHRYVLGSP